MSFSFSLRTRCLQALLLTTWLAPGTGHALRFDPPISPAVSEDVFGVRVFDANGDGLPDLVTTHTSARGTLSVHLQREDGNFDFPLQYHCDCRIGQVYQMAWSDSVRPLMVIDAYDGFIAVELLEDDTFTAVHYWDGFIDGLLRVDANQDGAEDLFYSYFSNDDTTPLLEFRYALWYGGSGRDKVVGQRNVSRGGFFRYQSAPFLYSGIDDIRFTQTPPIASGVDLDADGYLDAIEGRCPQDCFYKQQPYRQLTARTLTTLPQETPSLGSSAFGDLDGDGLPERVWTQPGDYRNSMEIYLQTAPETFELAARYGPLPVPSNPLVADMDNDGRNDIVVASMDENINNSGWLDVLLQTAPGQFEVTSNILFMLSENNGISTFDFDHNGCRDILLAQRMPNTLARTVQIFRAFDCLPATDFSVETLGDATAPIVRVRRLLGVAPTVPRIVRVTLAPAVRDGASVGFAVTAPASCTETGAEAPRRMYDCVLQPLGERGEANFSFGMSLNPATSVDVQVTAFLLDSAGDLHPENNRAQLRATLSTVVAAERGP
ncbi:MAG: VCBS repeat-containing protein [Lysobacteraceae bacterium]|nr:MAG: VCBS repeat-containing protein [Xanthomonadaceae bacterium]